MKPDEVRRTRSSRADPVTELLSEVRELRSALEAARQAAELNKKSGNGGNGGNGSWLGRLLTEKVIAWIIVGVVALTAWVGVMNVKIALLENNIFTDADAREMEERIKDGIPPRWFQDIVGNQGLQLGELERRVRALEQKR